MITSNTMSGSGSTMMQESSSSGSLVNSVILNTKQGVDGDLVSEPNSPLKKDNDRSSEDDSVYHSCVSQDEIYQGSATDISGTTPTGGCITPTRGSGTPPFLGALDISGITVTLGDASLSSTPATVRSRYFLA
ncbi:uncharacterized protein LOC111698649 [Eurytemora carolleeae]|uniref:uncharacterized protein LOC111698649 n=1 Tax=Eurytemora carolleeae TaxID=1294199 RepID=UPI000C769412|nr:uncharacterized protein LOC111698649 [Eurytemora carolleeae]|eukprot:XP_023324802.1 uncharacterized protein LOC111698649 [Eurytemora affinis]